MSVLNLANRIQGRGEDSHLEHIVGEATFAPTCIRRIAARRRSSVLGARAKRAWAARSNATVCGLAGSAGWSTDWHRVAKIRQSDSYPRQVLAARLPRA
jgi:hypothetical protein